MKYADMIKLVAERERVNDMGLYILLAVLAVLVIFICVLLIRAALAAKKAEPKRRERVQLSHLATVTAGGQTLHILQIGGSQYELSLRDTAAGFRLTGADRDSLYLEREGAVCGVKRCDE